jgi:GNAT superfamily N-acetyltransferase
MEADAPLIRRLEAHELARVAEIDVTETDDVVVVQRGRAIETTSTDPWSRSPRDAHAWSRHVDGWRATLAAGGAAWGAFVDGRLAGIIVLRRRVRPPATDQLEGLFVDRATRRRGIASALIAVLEAEARAGGATALVVSATPSRSAVGTYLRAGFEPSDDPVPELLAIEPEDIQMETSLRRS